ncbi:MAG: CotH kinase family protein [bacterium]
MRRRLLTWFMLLGVALVIAGLCGSDNLIFKRPDRLATRYRDKIAERLRAKGIVAYWDFDEAQVVDRVGLGDFVTDGTRIVPGRYGNARSFLRDERGFLETAVKWTSLGDECTIGMWLRIPDATREFSILGDHYTRFRLEARGDRIVFTARGEDEEAVLAARIPMTNAFFHVACCVSASGSNAVMYVNGRAVATAPVRSLRAAQGKATFGQSFYSAAPLVDVDDAAFWGRVLPAGEVGRIATSRRSVGMDVAGRYVRRATRNIRYRDAMRSLARAFDMFDPAYHSGRIQRANLPEIDLTMSKADMHCLNTYQNRCVENGLNALDTSEKRLVAVTLGGETSQARIEIISDGYDAVSRLRRKAYAVNIGDPGSGKPYSRVLLEPPEALSFMRFALAGELAVRCGYPAVKPELCILSINGGFEGVYFMRRASTAAELMLLNRIPRDCGQLIGSFPVSREDVLRDFDEVAGRIVPLLCSDPKMPFGHREIRHAVAGQREQAGRNVAVESFASDEERVARAAGWLSERLLVGNNPAPEYVVGNIDLSAGSINGVSVAFRSESPEVLGSDGAVSRPQAEPADAVLIARLQHGAASLEKKLHFAIVPTNTCLPFLRMEIDGEPGPDHRRPCMVEVLDDHGTSRTGPYPARVKWRGNTTIFYPKKNYTIKMDSPYSFLGMGRTRYLMTTAWMKDGSLIREMLSYQFWRLLAPKERVGSAPNSVYVEIAVNGEYQGINGFCERIDGNYLGFDPELVGSGGGGVLYKAVGATANFQTPRLRAVVQREPDWRSDEHWDPYIRLLGALSEPDRDVFRRSVAKVVDVDNVMDFEILVNLTQNGDGVNHNLYLARNDAVDSRFFIVPYDYDKTYHRSVTNGWFHSNYLFNRLRADMPEYSLRQDARWKGLRSSVLSEEAVLARIDGIEQSLEAGGALRRNSSRWTAPEGRPHERQVQEIKEWLSARLTIMDAIIGGFAGTSAQVEPRSGGAVGEGGGEEITVE